MLSFLSPPCPSCCPSPTFVLVRAGRQGLRRVFAAAHALESLHRVPGEAAPLQARGRSRGGHPQHSPHLQRRGEHSIRLDRPSSRRMYVPVAYTVFIGARPKQCEGGYDATPGDGPDDYGTCHYQPFLAFLFGFRGCCCCRPCEYGLVVSMRCCFVGLNCRRPFASLFCLFFCSSYLLGLSMSGRRWISLVIDVHTCVHYNTPVVQPLIVDLCSPLLSSPLLGTVVDGTVDAGPLRGASSPSGDVLLQRRSRRGPQQERRA